MEVVRPRIEAYLERGVPVEAQTIFVAENQRKLGPKLGAVKRAIPVCVEIRCQTLDSRASRVICHSRLMQSSPYSGEPLEWHLTATVRRDAKGLYVQEIQVPAHLSTEAEQVSHGKPVTRSS